MFWVFRGRSGPGWGCNLAPVWRRYTYNRVFPQHTPYSTLSHSQPPFTDFSRPTIRCVSRCHISSPSVSTGPSWLTFNILAQPLCLSFHPLYDGLLPRCHTAWIGALSLFSPVRSASVFDVCAAVAASSVVYLLILLPETQSHFAHHRSPRGNHGDVPLIPSINKRAYTSTSGWAATGGWCGPLPPQWDKCEVDLPHSEDGHWPHSLCEGLSLSTLNSLIFCVQSRILPLQWLPFLLSESTSTLPSTDCRIVLFIEPKDKVSFQGEYHQNPLSAAPKYKYRLFFTSSLHVHWKQTACFVRNYLPFVIFTLIFIHCFFQIELKSGLIAF